MTEQTCTQESLVELELRVKTEEFSIDCNYGEDKNWNRGGIYHIEYYKKIHNGEISSERMIIDFLGISDEYNRGKITRIGDKMIVQPNFSDSENLKHLDVRERLKGIRLEIRESILDQLGQISPEARSLLEGVFE